MIQRSSSVTKNCPLKHAVMSISLIPEILSMLVHHENQIIINNKNKNNSQKQNKNNSNSK